MDVLERLLRPVAAMMNREIRLRTPARELCAELAGRVVALRLRDTGLGMVFVVEEDGVVLLGDHEHAADVVITGSLLQLARLTADADADAIRNGDVELLGDGETAAKFQRLMKFARPDVEERLSGLVGDAAARGLGNLARGFAAWGRQTRETMEENLRDYLQHERRSLPDGLEAEAFRREVAVLRDDVERFEARLARLEKPAAPDPGRNT